MTVERDIDYEALAQSALRGIVRTVLARVARSGLPGDHHFYIAFKTDAPGVGLSKRLKERYPEEMTVVLQHRFWDLAVSEDSFEVSLTFDGIPERLSVPFEAIKVFFDPSVPYGLQFEDLDAASVAAGQLSAQSGDRPAAKPATLRAKEADRAPPAGEAKAERKPRTPRRPSEKVAPAGPPRALPRSETAAAKPEELAPLGSKVIRIDAFRKK